MREREKKLRYLGAISKFHNPRLEKTNLRSDRERNSETKKEKKKNVINGGHFVLPVMAKGQCTHFTWISVFKVTFKDLPNPSYPKFWNPRTTFEIPLFVRRNIFVN